MNFYGIRGIPHEWFKSYLMNRKQFVVFDNVSSQRKTITTGVPQGSVLGPLLFLLFINDLHYVSDQLTLILFADDTNIFISGNSVHQLNLVLNQELAKVGDWFSANRLIVNMKKTNYMVFKGRNTSYNLDDLHVQLNNVHLTRVHTTKFLGVHIDDSLGWKSHVSYVASKMASVLGILHVVKKMLPQRILMNIYNTLILPHLSYATIIWGNCPKTLINRLVVLQKKALRAITNSSYRAHTASIYKNLRILNVKSLYVMQLAQFMYQFKKEQLPCIFHEMFKVNAQVHTHNTRGSQNFHLPSFKTTMSQKSISYSGPMLWNQLPKDIGKCSSLHSFKSKLKTYLILNPNFDIDYGVWLFMTFVSSFLLSILLFWHLYYMYLSFYSFLLFFSMVPSTDPPPPPTPTNNPTCRLSSL